MLIARKGIFIMAGISAELGRAFLALGETYPHEADERQIEDSYYFHQILYKLFTTLEAESTKTGYPTDFEWFLEQDARSIVAYWCNLGRSYMRALEAEGRQIDERGFIALVSGERIGVEASEGINEETRIKITREVHDETSSVEMSFKSVGGDPYSEYDPIKVTSEFESVIVNNTEREVRYELIIDNGRVVRMGITTTNVFLDKKVPVRTKSEVLDFSGNL